MSVPPPQRIPRSALVLLAACAAFHLAWFAACTATDSFGLDETITMTQMKPTLRGLLRAVRLDTGPPGWFFGLWLWWKAVGPDEWLMRLPSALAVAAMPFPLYFGLRRLVPDRTALLAVVLTVLSPYVMRNSAEIRFYPVLQLLSALSLLSLLRLEESLDLPGRAWIGRGLLWSAIGAAILYTHTLSAFYLWTQGGWLLARRGRCAIWRWLPFLALAGLLFVPWLPYSLEQSSLPHLNWIGDVIRGKIGLPLLADTAVHFVSGAGDPSRGFARHAPPVFLFFPLFAVGAAALSRGLTAASAGKSADARVPRSLLAVLMVAVPPALLLLLSYVKPLYSPRYVLPSLPFFMLCVAAGIATLPTRALRLAAAAACVAALAAGTWRTRVSWPLDDWRGIARHILDSEAMRPAAADEPLYVLADRWEHARVIRWHIEREAERAGRPIEVRVRALPDTKNAATFIARGTETFWYTASPGELAPLLDRLSAAGTPYIAFDSVPSGGFESRCRCWRLERVPAP